MNEQESYEILKKYLDIVSNHYKFCRIRYILTKNIDNWKIYNFHMLFIDQEVLPKKELNYENYRFYDQIITVEEGLELFYKLFKEKNIILNDISYPLNELSFYLENKYYYRNDFNINWPFLYIDRQIPNVSNPDNFYHPFLDKEMPFFSSMETAVNYWFDINKPDNRSGRQSYGMHFIVIFPNYSIKISKVIVNINSMDINFIIYNNQVSRYLCKYEIEYENEIVRGESIVDKTYLTIAIKNYPLSLHIYILDLENGLECDRFENYRIYSTEDSRLEFRTNEINLDYLIQNGENEITEFKQEYPKKDIDFLETISAFSNTKGGLILIGVDDNGNIVGNEVPDIGKKIVDIINEKIDPSINITTKEFNIQTKQVFVLEVPEGKNKPYFVKGDSAYTRRGSTDKKASRAEMEELYKRDNNVFKR